MTLKQLKENRQKHNEFLKEYTTGKFKTRTSLPIKEVSIDDIQDLELTFGAIEAMIVYQGYKIHHLLKSESSAMDDENGFVVAIVEKDNNFYIIHEQPCIYVDLNDYDFNKIEFNSLEECYEFLSQIPDKLKEFEYPCEVPENWDKIYHNIAFGFTEYRDEETCKFENVKDIPYIPNPQYLHNSLLDSNYFSEDEDFILKIV